MITALAAMLLAVGAPTANEIVPPAFLKLARPSHAAKGAKGADGIPSKAQAKSGVPGIDSLRNWTGSFAAAGFDDNGAAQGTWNFSMIGRPPERGGTTVIPAPIIPVIVDLLDQDGTVAVRNGKPLTADPTRFVRPVLRSPIFQPFQYESGYTQFNDAMLRAEFWNNFHNAGWDNDGDEDDHYSNGWHTLLDPSVKTTRRIQVPYGQWKYAPNADGGCCQFILVDANTFGNLLFPGAVVDNSTPIGAAELAGDMTPRSLATFLFDNVYLFDAQSGGGCCILGYHSYDQEPGDASNGNLPKRFVMNYSSYVTPGLFDNLADVSTLSHEIAEAMHDPFTDNATPWWLSVDSFYGYGICQNNLETGDVVEVLTNNPIFPVYMNGRTYHVQNEAMFSWFAFQSPSTSLHGAYSFPDENVLPALSPAGLKPGCQ